MNGLRRPDRGREGTGYRGNPFSGRAL